MPSAARTRIWPRDRRRRSPLARPSRLQSAAQRPRSDGQRCRNNELVVVPLDPRDHERCNGRLPQPSVLPTPGAHARRAASEAPRPTPVDLTRRYSASGPRDGLVRDQVAIELPHDRGSCCGPAFRRNRDRFRSLATDRPRRQGTRRRCRVGRLVRAEPSGGTLLDHATSTTTARSRPHV